MPAKSQQITVRGVDPRLRSHLDKEARKRGWSLNRTVLHLLHQGTGLLSNQTEYTDLDEVLGQWSIKEGAAFDESLAKMRQVDSEIWS